MEYLNKSSIPFKYYLEKMKNIKTIHLVIVPIDNDGIYYYNVKTSSVQKYNIQILDLKDSSKQYSLDISLPLHCKIEPASTFIHKKPTLNDNSIEIKSKLLIDSTNYDEHLFIEDHHSTSIDSVNSILNEIFNNNSDNSNKISLYCKYCLNSFLTFNNTCSNSNHDNSNFSNKWRIKVLPSSNWVDLMDIWLCGCTGTSNFVDFPTGDINATVNHCFIGDRFLLFHKDNIKEDSVIDLVNYVDKEEKEQPQLSIIKESDLKWYPLECKYCHSYIASKQFNNFRFYKHQISTVPLPPNNSSNLFRQYILETFIASQMLCESQSTIIYKFLLVSLNDNKIYAMISLLNWDTLLLTNYYNSNENKNEQFIPILKILYKTTINNNINNNNSNNNNNNNNNENLDELINKWDFEYEAKRIYLPTEECFQIIDIMNQSNGIFPNVSKQFKNNSNVFNIGMLRLRINV